LPVRRWLGGFRRRIFHVLVQERNCKTKIAPQDATKAAVGISYFVAALTGLLAVLSIVYRHQSGTFYFAERGTSHIAATQS